MDDEEVDCTWLAQLPTKVYCKSKASSVSSEKSSCTSSPANSQSGRMSETDPLNHDVEKLESFELEFSSAKRKAIYSECDKSINEHKNLDLDSDRETPFSNSDNSMDGDQGTCVLREASPAGSKNVEIMVEYCQNESFGDLREIGEESRAVIDSLAQLQIGEPGVDIVSEQDKKDQEQSKLSKQEKIEFNELVCKARDYEVQGDFGEAVKHYEEAKKIHDSNGKLERKILKLKTLAVVRRQSMMQRESTVPIDMEAKAKGWGYDSAVEEFFFKAQPSFHISRDVFEILLPYQREGVAWLCDLHFRACGGILGDDMGLGKTCQTIAFLNGLFLSNLASRVLIVAPVPVLGVWEREIEKFAPGLVGKVRLFHGTNVKERNRNLSHVERKGGICLTSYGLCANHAESLAEVPWDYMICDEGHKLKNPSIQLSRRLRTIPARHRLLLTGTPLQNGLEELWALMDFAVPGLLGTAAAFRDRFVRPVVEANDRHADPRQRALGAARARELRERLEAFHLARRKAQVLDDPSDPPAPASSGPAGPGPGPGLSEAAESGAPGPGVEKREWIVWVGLTAAQLGVYRAFLQSDRVREALNTTRSPLAAITVLKKICDHPLLLRRAASAPGSPGPDPQVQALLEACQPKAGAGPEAWAAGSGKLGLVLGLLADLEREGHRTLVFSQARTSPPDAQGRRPETLKGIKGGTKQAEAS